MIILMIIMIYVINGQQYGSANAIKINQKNKFVGTVMWTTFDFLTFGVFEKNATKNNQT
jgi:hypothetical protein